MPFSDETRRKQWAKAYRSAAQKANPAKYAAAQARWYRLRAYGLSPEGYDTLFVEQGGCCAICQKPLLSTKDTHVDHDHDRPGTHRGLLCQLCNLGLGRFHDNPVLLAAALEYLHRY
jgi:hypothetical protein